MLKTLIAAAAAACVGAAGAAYAADVYSNGGLKDEPFVGYPIWAGYYAGVNVGGAWSSTDFSDPNNAPPVLRFSTSDSGVIGGGQFGFIYQRGPLVIGPEVDLGGIGISGTAREPGGPLLAKSSSGFYGDFTGRLGYAFGPALVYLKGGYAYFGGDVNLNDVASVHTVSGTNGFTLGGGLEYRINPAWSVKGEYQYIDLGSHNVLMPSGNIYNYDLNVQAVKFGVNFHFPGGYAAPLK
jgi:outer membrane immunogenic protein